VCPDGEREQRWRAREGGREREGGERRQGEWEGGSEGKRAQRPHACILLLTWSEGQRAPETSYPKKD
jgi:hypothetical protein